MRIGVIGMVVCLALIAVRAAAHEFAHLFLGTESIHRSTDIHSYEDASADRAAQYYGRMHWDIAGPMLLKRLGSTVSSSR